MLANTKTDLYGSTAGVCRVCAGAARVTFHRDGCVVGVLTPTQAKKVDEVIDLLEEIRELVNARTPRPAAAALRIDEEIEVIRRGICEMARKLSAEGIHLEIVQADGSWIEIKFGDPYEMHGRVVRVTASRC